jgi:hypothetical protein
MLGAMLNKELAVLAFSSMLCPIYVLGQDEPNPDDVHHVNNDGVPVVNSVMDKTDRPAEADQIRCIEAEHDLAQYVEELNGKLFHMETQRQGKFFVRHGDRMAIISLIQREMNSPTDKIHHAIFWSAPDGSGKYCEKTLIDATGLAQKIYDTNLGYRRINNNKGE